MNAHPEYSVTIIDRSAAAPVENGKKSPASGIDSYPTHSMFNLDTPFYPITPDIPDRCQQCGFHVRMSLKYDHDLFHKALQTLGYSGCGWPSDISNLVDRRQKIVQEAVNKLKIARNARKDSKAAKYQSRFLKFVNEVNVAFSVVKMYVEDEYEIGQKPHSTVYISGKTNLTIPTNSNVLLAASLNEQNLRWQKVLMNTSVYIDDLYSDSNFSDDSAFFDDDGAHIVTDANENNYDMPSVQFMGVYSGYNGEASSNLCYERFHHVLADKFKSVLENKSGLISDLNVEASRNRMIKLADSDYTKSVKKGFVETFERVDELVCMGEGEFSAVRWSGVSVSTCVFENIGETSVVHVANCGDNRILACRDGEAIRLSKVHNLSHKSERDRIKEKPDCMKYMKKVENTHATRGIGNLGDKTLRQVVVPVPSCASYVIDDTTEFILIGSRGLFNVLSESQCIKICKSVLPKYFVEIKRNVEEQLVSEDEEVDVDLNKNKTVTFQSPSRLHEILQSRTDVDTNEIQDAVQAEKIMENMENGNSYVEKNEVGHNASPEVKNERDLIKKPVDGSEKSETTALSRISSGKSENKSEQESNQSARSTSAGTTTNKTERSESNAELSISQSGTALSNQNENENEVESSEGSPIVSRVHTPSSTDENDSSKGSKSITPEKHVSESEVYKGLSLKALMGELSNVTVDAKTDWYQYLPSMAKSICEKLCLSAMKNGCKENISCAILFLPAIKKRVEFDSETPLLDNLNVSN